MAPAGQFRTPRFYHSLSFVLQGASRDTSPTLSTTYESRLPCLGTGPPLAIRTRTFYRSKSFQACEMPKMKQVQCASRVTNTVICTACGSRLSHRGHPARARTRSLSVLRLEPHGEPPARVLHHKTPHRDVLRLSCALWRKGFRPPRRANQCAAPVPRRLIKKAGEKFIGLRRRSASQV